MHYIEASNLSKQAPSPLSYTTQAPSEFRTQNLNYLPEEESTLLT